MNLKDGDIVVYNSSGRAERCIGIVIRNDKAVSDFPEILWFIPANLGRSHYRRFEYESSMKFIVNIKDYCTRDADDS